MIAAMKQVGVNVARRTFRRYVIQGAGVVALFVIGVGYRVVTGRSLNAANGDTDSAVTAEATPRAAAPKAAASAPSVAEAVIAPQGVDLNAPKRAAQNAVAAANAQLAAQTGQAVPTSGQLAAPISGPGSKGSGVPASPTASLAASGALPDS